MSTDASGRWSSHNVTIVGQYGVAIFLALIRLLAKPRSQKSLDRIDGHRDKAHLLVQPR